MKSIQQVIIAPLISATVHLDDTHSMNSQVRRCLEEGVLVHRVETKLISTKRNHTSGQTQCDVVGNLSSNMKHKFSVGQDQVINLQPSAGLCSNLFKQMKSIQTRKGISRRKCKWMLNAE